MTLLCSGTQGAVSLEDILGAGAVLDAMAAARRAAPAGDLAAAALRLFRGARGDFGAALREGAGGHNVIHAGLEPDIDFCTALDSLSVVGVVRGDSLTVKALETPSSVEKR